MVRPTLGFEVFFETELSLEANETQWPLTADILSHLDEPLAGVMPGDRFPAGHGQSMASESSFSGSSQGFPDDVTSDPQFFDGFFGAPSEFMVPGLADALHYAPTTTPLNTSFGYGDQYLQYTAGTPAQAQSLETTTSNIAT